MGMLLKISINAAVTGTLPGGGVWKYFVEVGHRDDILGHHFIVAHTSMLEPVAPENLVRKIRGPDLKRILEYSVC